MASVPNRPQLIKTIVGSTRLQQSIDAQPASA
eukprot:CAMPEP_0204114826 /NCGR_PEP_ID=MMETSP0361-20130328/4487_1 /ASSEMBLY_ACC=CAM_ASM_000343 /TAXON_ID=268821 /ORGANISM="Scrippsiella Hangoei, Strain SHTV-5" /LENGTH=31 /DNA_ID= /DNA_START= /DNA_END= /DNA_ORIENTATION=